jgi:hypothetical protein
MDGNDDASGIAWGLVEPFNTDDLSLDDVSAEEAFALGVEWQQFRERLKCGKRFTTFVLAHNAARLTTMAERHRRFVEHRPAITPGWAEITVGDYVV